MHTVIIYKAIVCISCINIIVTWPFSKCFHFKSKKKRVLLGVDLMSPKGKKSAKPPKGSGKARVGRGRPPDENYLKELVTKTMREQCKGLSDWECAGKIERCDFD